MSEFLKKNRIVLIAVALVLVVAIGVGSFFVIQKNQEESATTTTERSKKSKKETTTEESTEEVTNEEEEDIDTLFPDLSHLARHAPNMYIEWVDDGSMYNAVTIDWKCTEDAWGTYWAVHNWSYGYAGFQNVLGQHVLLLSLWDLDDGTRPAIEYTTSDFHGDFGGEGEGKQVYTHYDWKVDTWYSMKIEQHYSDGKTYFTQYIKEEDGEWLKTASISYPKKVSFLHVTSLFQEDFSFNNLSRSCEVKNAGGWVSGTNKWVQWTNANVTNSFFPDNEATWENGVMENISFNCDYRCDGTTIWVESGGYDLTPKDKSFPAYVTIK